MERLVLTGALALLWTTVACQNACNSTSTIVIAFPELDPPNKPSETDPVYTKAILTNGRPFNVSFTFSPDDKRKKFPFDDYFRHNFSASTNSYVISMKQGIDRDGKTSSPFDDTDFINYTMYCQAVDGGTVEEKKLAIQILDVNDNAPLFSFQSYGVFLNEFAPVGVTVLRGIVADDLDAGLNREITYRLTPVALGVPSVYNGTDYFYLPPEKGDEVTLIQSAVLPTLSLTSQFDFYFLVTAQDRAVPASSQRSSKTSVYVSVFNGSEPSIGVYYPSCIQPVVPSPKKCILPRYYTSVTFGDTSEIKLELYPEPPDPNNTGTPVDIMFQDESLINGSQIPIVSILETLPSNYEKFFTVSVIKVGTNNFKCELRKVAGKALNSTSFKTLQISLEIDEDPLLPEWVTIYVMVKGPFAPVLLSNSTECYIYENATLGSRAISDKSNGGLYKLMFSDPNKYSSSPGIFDVTVLPGTPFTVDNDGFVSLANGALDYESQQIYNVTVIVSIVDCLGCSTQVTLTVNVIDVNEHSPEIVSPESLILSVPPGDCNCNIARTITTIQARDVDFGPLEFKLYRVIPPAAFDKFTVDSGGAVSLHSPVVSGQVFALIVQVFDHGDPVLMTEAIVIISVNALVSKSTSQANQCVIYVNEV